MVEGVELKVEGVEKLLRWGVWHIRLVDVARIGGASVTLNESVYLESQFFNFSSECSILFRI
jgi:hypothetical protein